MSAITAPKFPHPLSGSGLLHCVLGPQDNEEAFSPLPWHKPHHVLYACWLPYSPAMPSYVILLGDY